MQVTNSPVIWTGTASSAWSFAGSDSNWRRGSTSTAYADGLGVQFDDSGTNTNPISIVAGGVSPFSVTFTNNTKPYSFTNPDNVGISGVASVTLAGPGTVTFNAGNTYSGGTFLNAGKLVVGTSDDSALGTAPASPATNVTFNGGTLSFAGASNPTVNANRSISLAGPGAIEVQQAGNTVTVAGQISGTGTLTTSGLGTLSLSNTNTYGGGTIVAPGSTLVAANFNALGSGAVTLEERRQALAHGGRRPERLFQHDLQRLRRQHPRNGRHAHLDRPEQQ